MGPRVHAKYTIVPGQAVSARCCDFNSVVKYHSKISKTSTGASTAAATVLLDTAHKTNAVKLQIDRSRPHINNSCALSPPWKYKRNAIWTGNNRFSSLNTNAARHRNMFGYGAAANMVKPLAITRWDFKATENANKITVCIYTIPNGHFRNTSYDEAIATVRVVCDAAASSMVKAYVTNTKGWMASHATRGAVDQEYTRIQAELQTKFDSGEYVLMKRYMQRDSGGRTKRLKLTAVDTELKELGELGVGAFYDVENGHLEVANGTGMKIMSDGGFDLESLVPTSDTGAAPAAALGMVGDPLRQTLQLKHYLTSIKQMSNRETTDFLEDITPVGGCLRGTEMLVTEFAEVCTMAARALVLTVPSGDNAPGWVAMMPGNLPHMLVNLGNGVHESAPNGTHVRFKVIEIDATTTFLCKQLGATPASWKTYGIATRGGFEPPPSFPGVPHVYFFEIPAAVVVKTETFDCVIMHDLLKYEVAQADLALSLGGRENCLQRLVNLGTWLGGDCNGARVRRFDRNTTTFSRKLGGETTTVAGVCGDNNNVGRSFVSSCIYEPALAAKARGAKSTPRGLIKSTVDFIKETQLSDDSTTTAFLRSVYTSAYEHISEEPLVRLRPVPVTELDWLTQNKALPILQFGTHTIPNKDGNSVAWAIGSAPSTSLDALEVALTLLHA